MKDTVVMITGAARGLGCAMTLALAAAGARVAALDLPMSDDEMAKLLQRAGQGAFADRILPLHCDVGNALECAAAVAATVRRFGAVHGLVNNAARRLKNEGVELEVKQKFYEVDETVWRGVIDANVTGPYLMARAVVPHLMAQGWGRIVNIVTSYPTMLAAECSPYGQTKAALEAATVIWSRDLEGSGVTVNALLPGGPANTRMIPLQQTADRTTLIQPEVMAAPIRWLMSKASDGISACRFIAKDWDPQLDPAEASLRARSLAGWRV